MRISLHIVALLCLQVFTRVTSIVDRTGRTRKEDCLLPPEDWVRTGTPHAGQIIYNNTLPVKACTWRLPDLTRDTALLLHLADIEMNGTDGKCSGQLGYPEMREACRDYYFPECMIYITEDSTCTLEEIRSRSSSIIQNVECKTFLLKVGLENPPNVTLFARSNIGRRVVNLEYRYFACPPMTTGTVTSTAIQTDSSITPKPSSESTEPVQTPKLPTPSAPMPTIERTTGLGIVQGPDQHYFVSTVVLAIALALVICASLASCCYLSRKRDVTKANDETLLVKYENESAREANGQRNAGRSQPINATEPESREMVVNVLYGEAGPSVQNDAQPLDEKEPVYTAVKKN